MYQYELNQTVKGEMKKTLVFSSQHYTKAGFKKVVKEAIGDLKVSGIEIPETKKMDMIKRELINNYEFISVTDNKIDCDVAEL